MLCQGLGLESIVMIVDVDVSRRPRSRKDKVEIRLQKGVIGLMDRNDHLPDAYSARSYNQGHGASHSGMPESH